MWGKPADTWHDGKPRVKFGSSHKWHLVDPDSIEEREITMGGYYRTLDPLRPKIKRTFAAYMCGGKKVDWSHDYKGNFYDHRTPMILKETVNLNGSGICAYCKNFRLKELGLKEKVMG